MMTRPFNQIFLFPDEIVHSGILGQLSWKDLSHLDEALNNRLKRAQFHQWTRNVKLKFKVTSYTNYSQLDWMKYRGINISVLKFRYDADERSLLQIEKRKLEAKEVLLYFVVDDHIPKESMIHCLNSFAGLQLLTINVDDFQLSDSWIAMLKQHTALYLLSIASRGREAQSIAQIAGSCKILKRLTLHRCESVNDNSMASLAQHFQELEYLHLGSCAELGDMTLQALGSNCMQLHTLSLEATTGRVSDAGMIPLLQGCRKLESLRLWDCSGVTDQSLTALAPLCEQLRKLSIPRCSAFGTSMAAEAMMQFCNLTELNVNEATNMSEELLMAVVENNPKLVDLCLNEIAAVTDQLVAFVATKSLHLKQLKVSKCQGVTNLLPFVECTMLEALILNGCPAVRNETLLQLAASPGRCITVSACYSNVTTATEKLLQGSERVLLFRTGAIML